MKHIIAKHPKDLTCQWAQQVVNHHLSGVKVNQLAVTGVDIGTTTRIRVAVNHNGPDTLPRRWFVKLPSLNLRARAITALPRLLPTEIRFYQQLSTNIPIPQPTLLAGYSQLAKGSTLVLGDVTATGATPGKAYDSLTSHQAMYVVKDLAGFHAHFWHTAETDPKYRWLGSSIRTLEDRLGSALAAPLMRCGLRRAGQLVPHHLYKPAMHYAQRRKQAMTYLSAGTKTLVHHDCHPGNFFWHGDRPGLLDWQMVRLGEGISDIAYFLATALTPETRRRHEDNLLSCYHQALTAQGVGIIAEDLFQRFRAHLCYPFEAMTATLAIGGMMDLGANLELIRRTVAAVDDHQAFSALPI